MDNLNPVASEGAYEDLERLAMATPQTQQNIEGSEKDMSFIPPNGRNSEAFRSDGNVRKSYKGRSFLNRNFEVDAI